MKKPILLLCLLFISMLAIACGTSKELKVYEYSGRNDDTIYFDYTGETYRYENKQRVAAVSAEETRNFNFLGEEYELTYSETDGKEFLPYAEDYYTAGDIEFAFIENTKELSGVCCYSGAAINIGAGKTLSEEEDYRQVADTIVKEYADIANYTVECSSRVTVFEEQNGVAESSYGNYDYFYRGNNGKENVRYTFTYTREFQGYKTCEMIMITLNEDGQLCNLQLNAVGLFDDKSEPVAARSSIDKKVEQKLDELCREPYSRDGADGIIILCINQEGDYFYVTKVDAVIENTEDRTKEEAVCVFILAEE